ncbi:MAG: DUF86 domain-containing protein [Phycisphaerales bacterium]|nr:MAG: DUF86 domain-containing protein [Phycisphaerales bacterium]
MPPDSTPPLTSVPDPNDRRRLVHMLQSSRDAQTIVADLDARSLEDDMLRSRALVNCFTEIGEAAVRLSPEARARLGSIPWRDIIGMRNIVVHVYWGIDVAQLVATVRNDLPALIVALEQALAACPPDSPG